MQKHTKPLFAGIPAAVPGSEASHGIAVNRGTLDKGARCLQLSLQQTSLKVRGHDHPVPVSNAGMFVMQAC